MTLHKLFQRADVMFHKSYKGETRKQKVTSAQGKEHVLRFLELQLKWLLHLRSYLVKY